MIGAFLRTADGNFDYPALAISVPLIFFGTVLLFIVLPKSIHSGRIQFVYSTRAGTTITRSYGRAQNPLLYWSLFVVYFFTAIFFVAFAIVVCTGMMRSSSGN